MQWLFLCLLEAEALISLCAVMFQTLLLHGNVLTSLSAVPQCLPASLLTLSLQSNCIEDLTQVSTHSSPNVLRTSCR